MLELLTRALTARLLKHGSWASHGLDPLDDRQHRLSRVSRRVDGEAHLEVPTPLDGDLERLPGLETSGALAGDVLVALWHRLDVEAEPIHKRQRLTEPRGERPCRVHAHPETERPGLLHRRDECRLARRFAAAENHAVQLTRSLREVSENRGPLDSARNLRVLHRRVVAIPATPRATLGEHGGHELSGPVDRGEGFVPCDLELVGEHLGFGSKKHRHVAHRAPFH